ncbi:MAG: hypothetical protein KIH71_012180 [Roseobacter sp.]|nr:hypothetical protein [Roseobacter sp.]
MDIFGKKKSGAGRDWPGPPRAASGGFGPGGAARKAVEQALERALERADPLAGLGRGC